MAMEYVRKLNSRDLLDTVIEEALKTADSELSNSELSELYAICSDTMFRKGQYTSAVMYGEKSVEADPLNAEGFSCLGWAEYWVGKNKNALEHLRKAVELAPDSAEYHYRTGSILNNVFRELPAAEEEFTKAVKLDSGHMLAWQQRGICRWNQGNKEGSEADYRRGAALGDAYCGYILEYNGFPIESPEEKLSLARDYWGQNNSMHAVNLIKQALEQGFDSVKKKVDVRLELADKLSSMKLNEESEASYNMAIELNPSNPESFGRRGWLYYCISRDDEAEADFRKAMELDPENSRYPANLGNLYAVSGKPEEGLAVLDPAVEKDPLSANLFYSRALCRLKLKMDEEAKADFIKADLLGHGNAQNDRRGAYGDEFAMDFFSSGIELGEQNDPATAVEQFRKAAEMFNEQKKYPGDRAWRYTSKSLHNLGYYIHISGGNPDEAVENIQKALEMDPLYKDAWISLGNVHNTAGRNDRALECFNRAVKLQPNDGRGYYSRGRVHLADEEFDAGVKDFSRAVDYYTRRDWQGDAYYNRARCHEGAGRIHEAIADYEQAFNLGIQQGIHESIRLKDTFGID